MKTARPKEVQVLLSEYLLLRDPSAKLNLSTAAAVSLLPKEQLEPVLMKIIEDFVDSSGKDISVFYSSSLKSKYPSSSKRQKYCEMIFGSLATYFSRFPHFLFYQSIFSRLVSAEEYLLIWKLFSAILAMKGMNPNTSVLTIEGIYLKDVQTKTLLVEILRMSADEAIYFEEFLRKRVIEFRKQKFACVSTITKKSDYNVGFFLGQLIKSEFFRIGSESMQSLANEIDELKKYSERPAKKSRVMTMEAVKRLNVLSIEKEEKIKVVDDAEDKKAEIEALTLELKQLSSESQALKESSLKILSHHSEVDINLDLLRKIIYEILLKLIEIWKKRSLHDGNLSSGLTPQAAEMIKTDLSSAPLRRNFVQLLIASDPGYFKKVLARLPEFQEKLRAKLKQTQMMIIESKSKWDLSSPLSSEKIEDLENLFGKDCKLTANQKLALDFLLKFNECGKDELIDSCEELLSFYNKIIELEGESLDQTQGELLAAFSSDRKKYNDWLLEVQSNFNYSSHFQSFAMNHKRNTERSIEPKFEKEIYSSVQLKRNARSPELDKIGSLILMLKQKKNGTIATQTESNDHPDLSKQNLGKLFSNPRVESGNQNLTSSDNFDSQHDKLNSSGLGHHNGDLKSLAKNSRSLEKSDANSHELAPAETLDHSSHHANGDLRGDYTTANSANLCEIPANELVNIYSAQISKGVSSAGKELQNIGNPLINRKGLIDANVQSESEAKAGFGVTNIRNFYQNKPQKDSKADDRFSPEESSRQEVEKSGEVPDLKKENVAEDQEDSDPYSRDESDVEAHSVPQSDSEIVKISPDEEKDPISKKTDEIIAKKQTASLEEAATENKPSPRPVEESKETTGFFQFGAPRKLPIMIPKPAAPQNASLSYKVKNENSNESLSQIDEIKTEKSSKEANADIETDPRPAKEPKKFHQEKNYDFSKEKKEENGEVPIDTASMSRGTFGFGNGPNFTNLQDITNFVYEAKKLDEKVERPDAATPEQSDANLINKECSSEKLSAPKEMKDENKSKVEHSFQECSVMTRNAIREKGNASAHNSVVEEHFDKRRKLELGSDRIVPDKERLTFSSDRQFERITEEFKEEAKKKTSEELTDEMKEGFNGETLEEKKEESENPFFKGMKITTREHEINQTESSEFLPARKTTLKTPAEQPRNAAQENERQPGKERDSASKKVSAEPEEEVLAEKHRLSNFKDIATMIAEFNKFNLEEAMNQQVNHEPVSPIPERTSNALVLPVVEDGFEDLDLDMSSSKSHVKRSEDRSQMLNDSLEEDRRKQEKIRKQEKPVLPQKGSVKEFIKSIFHY